MTTTVSPQEQLAKAKLRALAQGVKVWVLDPATRYAVPSHSSDGTAYEVVVHSQGGLDVSCNCFSGVNRGVCKHIGAVLVRLDVEAQMNQAQIATEIDREKLEREIAELYD
jgi:hypothetical protein